MTLIETLARHVLPIRSMGLPRSGIESELRCGPKRKAQARLSLRDEALFMGHSVTFRGEPSDEYGIVHKIERFRHRKPNVFVTPFLTEFWT